MLFMWSLDTPKRQHVILFIVIKSLLWSTSDFLKFIGQKRTITRKPDVV